MTNPMVGRPVAALKYMVWLVRLRVDSIRHDLIVLFKESLYGESPIWSADILERLERKGRSNIRVWWECPRVTLNGREVKDGYNYFEYLAYKWGVE